MQPEYEVTLGLMGTGMGATVGMGARLCGRKHIPFVGDGEL